MRMIWCSETQLYILLSAERTKLVPIKLCPIISDNFVGEAKFIDDVPSYELDHIISLDFDYGLRFCPLRKVLGSDDHIFLLPGAVGNFPTRSIPHFINGHADAMVVRFSEGYKCCLFLVFRVEMYLVVS